MTGEERTRSDRRGFVTAPDHDRERTGGGDCGAAVLVAKSIPFRL